MKENYYRNNGRRKRNSTYIEINKHRHTPKQNRNVCHMVRNEKCVITQKSSVLIYFAGGSLQSSMVRNAMDQETIILCHFCRWYSIQYLIRVCQTTIRQPVLSHAMLFICLHSYTRTLVFPAFVSEYSQVKRIKHRSNVSCRLPSGIFASKKTQRIIVKFIYRSTLRVAKQILFGLLCIRNNFYCT